MGGSVLDLPDEVIEKSISALSERVRRDKVMLRIAQIIEGESGSVSDLSWSRAEDIMAEFEVITKEQS